MRDPIVAPEHHRQARVRLRTAGEFACLTVLFVTTGCLLREVSVDERTWVERDTRESPLTLTRTHDADGQLDSVRLQGTMHVYKSWLDGGVSRPLEPLRDLAVSVDFRIGRDDAHGQLDPHIKLRLRKVSPVFYGPRVLTGDRLEITLDRVRRSCEIDVATARNASLFFVTADALVPLSTFLGLGVAKRSRVRLASLSPFSLDGPQRQVVRQLDADLRTLGVSLREPPTTTSSDDDDSELRPFGYIKALRHGPQTPENRSRVILTASYPGPRIAPCRLTPTGWIDYPEKVPETPLVARMCDNEGTVTPVIPDEDVIDSRRAFELATLVADQLRESFGLEHTPETYTIVYPLGRYRGCVMSLVRPLGRGLSIGVPSIKGRIADRHASVLLWILAHEYAEGLLMIPELGAGCSLYGRDRHNRWIGDGIAEMIAGLVQARAQSEGFDLPPPTRDIRELVIALRHGRRSVNLSRWRTIRSSGPSGDQDTPGVGEGQGDTDGNQHVHGGPPLTFLRYLAAEYLVAEWRRRSTSPDSEAPLERLAKWLRDRPLGPTYEEITDWMSGTSGLDIASIAEQVDLREALRYHVDKWRALGRQVLRDANRFLEHGPD